MQRRVDIETFMRNIERQLEAPVPGGLLPTMRLDDLPGWTSCQALIVVASMEWDYGITLSSDEFRSVRTVSALYDMVVAQLEK